MLDPESILSSKTKQLNITRKDQGIKGEKFNETTLPSFFLLTMNPRLDWYQSPFYFLIRSSCIIDTRVVFTLLTHLLVHLILHEWTPDHHPLITPFIWNHQSCLLSSYLLQNFNRRMRVCQLAICVPSLCNSWIERRISLHLWITLLLLLSEFVYFKKWILDTTSFK